MKTLTKRNDSVPCTILLREDLDSGEYGWANVAYFFRYKMTCYVAYANEADWEPTQITEVVEFDSAEEGKMEFYRMLGDGWKRDSDPFSFRHDASFIVKEYLVSLA